MTRFSRYALAAFATAAVWSAPALAASPVVGTWATEAKSDFGTFKSVWTVAESNGAYTIDLKDDPMEGAPPGPPPESKISDLAVDGNTLTFNREIMFGDMAIKLSYTVTADGSTLTGTSHSDFGDIPITGTRQ
jgi:hypothetical protein